MAARFRLWLQHIRTHPVASVLIALLTAVIVLIVLSVLGYIFHWGWAGLSQKTLWDWLQLLIIPFVLAIGGYLFNFTTSRSEQKNAQLRDQTERDIASDNQREEALQSYIDNMSELLLERHLRESKEEDEVRTIARVRTLTVLPRLDGLRKRSILQFLHESGLIGKNKRIITLEGADLRGADLRGADLSKAILFKADLEGADLGGANLERTNLERANLNGVNLEGANLSGPILHIVGVDVNDPVAAVVLEATLTGAKLSRASLVATRLVH